MAKSDKTTDEESQEIITELQARFESAQEWEDRARMLANEDLKFGIADSDNGYQWPEVFANSRQLNFQPVLTINKTRIHCLQVINDAKQNKVACKVSPTGDTATVDAAQVFEGVIRHIEYMSNAEDAYDNAVWWQVYTGIGYWRVCADFVDDDSFDQALYIRPVRDPFSVYLDPDIQEQDGSDAKWGLFYTDIPRWRFDQEYPDLKEKVARDPIGEIGEGKVADKKIRMVEYYRRVPKPDTLIATPEGEMVFASELPPDLVKMLKADPRTKTRKVSRHEVEWFKIVGSHIVDRGIWPSQYIPIIRLPGEESIVDGQYDRRGHVRGMKDPQRSYNYFTSAAVELFALQPKVPYIGPMEAFSGLETYWDAANVTNPAWLPYNHVDDKGTPIPPPQRQQPPTISPAIMQGLQQASLDMQMVTGQFEAQMGQEGDEKSGVALLTRQRRGDNATYGFVNALAMAIRYTGRILIDMIPKVYDTERVIQIMEEDGTQKSVAISTQMQQPLSSDIPEGQDVALIFNPNVGRYAVQADVGPSFGTRRQETFDALMRLAAADKSLIPVAGDLIVKSADFALADELAERLKRMVPAQALGGPSPEQQQMAQKLQQSQSVIEKLMRELMDKRAEQDDRLTKREIEEYRADTDRMKAIKDIDPAALVPIVRLLQQSAMGLTLPDVARTDAPMVPQ